MLRPSVLGVLAGAAATLVVAGCGGGSDSPAGRSGAAPAKAPQKEVVADVRAPSKLPPGGPPDEGYAPWPAAGHDARHSGSAPVVGPQNGTLRWKRELEGPVVPGPIVGPGGVVFAASNGGTLHALEPKTGKDRWTLDGGGFYGSDLTTSPLLTPDGLLLWPGPSSTLFGIESKTGKERWRMDLGAMGLSPALGEDGTVYVADAGGGLRALDVSGSKPKVRWTVSLGDGGSFTSPSLARKGGVTTVYGGVGESVVAVRDEGDRGKIAWRARTGQLVEVSTAVAEDGTVFVGSNDKRIHAYGPDGKQRWESNLKSLTYSSPAAAADGTVLIGDHRGAVNRLSAKDGKLIARYVGIPQTPRQRSVGVWTAPAVDSRGDVYFGTRVGHIYGFSFDGRKLLDITTGATVDSNPALGPDGTLYIGSEDGHLYAVRGGA